jgi:hypothetical protein
MHLRLVQGVFIVAPNSDEFCTLTFDPSAFKLAYGNVSRACKPLHPPNGFILIQATSQQSAVSLAYT